MAWDLRVGFRAEGLVVQKAYNTRFPEASGSLKVELTSKSLNTINLLDIILRDPIYLKSPVYTWAHVGFCPSAV